MGNNGEQDRGRTRRSVLRELGAIGTVGLAGCATRQRNRDDERTSLAERTGSEGTLTGDALSCSLPVFTDEYVGFRVGRPDGWRIEYQSGIIWMWPETDPSGRTRAFVYPGRLQDTSMAAVVNGVVAGIDAALAPQGSIGIESPDGLTGTINNAPIEGELRTTTQDSFGVVWGGWSPAAAWPTRRETIMATGTCFEPLPGQPLFAQSVQGSDASGTAVWTYLAPNGWEPLTVSSAGIDIVGEPFDGEYRAQVSYSVNTAAVPVTPLDHLRMNLQPIQASSRYFEIVNTSGVWTERDPLGTNWEFMAMEIEFLDRLRDGSEQLIRGVLISAVAVVDVGMGQVHSAIRGWSRLALAADWDRLSAITSLVASNLARAGHQVDIEAPPGTETPSWSDTVLDAARARDEVTDRTQQEFVDYVMDYERVQNPTDPSTEVLVPNEDYYPAGTCYENQRPVRNPETGEIECWPLTG